MCLSLCFIMIELIWRLDWLSPKMGLADWLRGGKCHTWRATLCLFRVILYLNYAEYPMHKKMSKIFWNVPPLQFGSEFPFIMCHIEDFFECHIEAHWFFWIGIWRLKLRRLFCSIQFIVIFLFPMFFIQFLIKIFNCFEFSIFEH